jgi:hypothetical protein
MAEAPLLAGAGWIDACVPPPEALLHPAAAVAPNTAAMIPRARAALIAFILMLVRICNRKCCFSGAQNITQQHTG